MFAGPIKARTGPWAESLKGIEAPSEAGQATVVRDGKGLLVLLSLGDRAKSEGDTLRRAGGWAAEWLIGRKIPRAGLETAYCPVTDGVVDVGSLCEGLVLGAFEFGQFKSKSKRGVTIGVDILVSRTTQAAKRAVTRAGHVAQAANLAREIAHQPPNVINPVSLAARARRMCRQAGLSCKVLDEKQMSRLRMGGILAVGQGSAAPPRLIIMSYPGQRTAKPVVLVGKAVTFDTGGYSIKPRDGIVGMKYDKCGGMAVLGAMRAVAAIKPKVPVIGIVAAAENMISHKAYRPDDIIKTLSGKTVEIVSADAEGRLVLCDALTYAQKHWKPRAIIDLATLTGGVVVALGNHRAGLFASQDTLRDALMESAERTCERLWPMPMDDAYFDLLSSTDADFKNSSTREAHAIQGAVFLKQFVNPKTPWAHLDIAGVAAVTSDQPYCPKGATGFGVRLLADYLQRLA
ncbi:MAG: M17 family metallopeptidase [Phycisphaerae bacterium]